jgi:hypothetical protein
LHGKSFVITSLGHQSPRILCGTLARTEALTAKKISQEDNSTGISPTRLQIKLHFQ